MSCKDVCVIVDYDRSNEFYHESTRRAAKDHKCCECGDPIAKGERYEAVAGKSEGDIWSAKTCLVCVEVRRAFCCDGWTFGTLWNDIAEQLFPSWNEVTAIDCLARLDSPEAVAKMRAEYADWNGEADDEARGSAK